MRIRDRDSLSPDVVRELAALDAALAGEAVQADLAELSDLALALREERLLPREDFARSLDERVECGFRGAAAAAPATRRPLLRWTRGRSAPLALATAASVFIVATAVVTSGLLSSGGNGPKRTKGHTAAREIRGAQPLSKGGTEVPKAASTTASGGASGRAPASPTPPPDVISRARHRRVERSASLTLAPPRDEIEEVADAVIRTTDRYEGFVLDSSVSSGEPAAGATLHLRVPATRLAPALAELSKLAHVRSRMQGTLDITARFSTPRRRLAGALGERRALLRLLAHANSENETASIRARLRLANRRIDTARAALRRLANQVGFVTVAVAIEPGARSAEGSWTLGDALRDARSVFGVALGGLIIVLAVALPLALCGLVAWQARRSYLRRARERALNEPRG
jgi:hypothetical protein